LTEEVSVQVQKRKAEAEPDDKEAEYQEGWALFSRTWQKSSGFLVAKGFLTSFAPAGRCACCRWAADEQMFSPPPCPCSGLWTRLLEEGKDKTFKSSLAAFRHFWAYSDWMLYHEFKVS
jgi:hypothetical protein